MFSKEICGLSALDAKFAFTNGSLKLVNSRPKNYMPQIGSINSVGFGESDSPRPFCF